MHFFAAIIILTCLRNQAVYEDLVRPAELPVTIENNWRLVCNDECIVADTSCDLTVQTSVNIKDDLMRYVSGRAGIVRLCRSVKVDTSTAGRDLAVFFGRVAVADETYWNGVRIGGAGRFPPEGKIYSDEYFSAWNKPRGYIIPKAIIRPGEENRLVIKVYVNQNGWIEQASLMTPEEMNRRLQFQTFFLNDLNLALVFVLMTVGMYYLLLFISRPRERENIIFAVSCLFSAGSTSNFAMSDLPISYFLKEKIIFACTPALTASISLFFKYFFDLKTSFDKWAVGIILAANAGHILFLAISPDMTALWFRNMYTPFPILLGVIYILITIIRALRLKRKYSSIIAVGTVIAALFAVHDQCLNLAGISNKVYLFTYAIPLFLLTIALVLANDFFRTRREVDELNAHLEEMVAQRTEELRRARDELWGEMQLAKKIQTVLLPEHPSIPGFSISAFMAPAVEVGGDYYDVINTRGLDWIIIGDVSGHGVSAGLVMMMVQTAIHVTLDNNPNLIPSQLLSQINNTIRANIERMGEDKYMTITVFAVHRNGEFLFSGLHENILVYRHSTQSVERIETYGMWIGLTDNIDTMLRDDTLVLHEGDTVLIYTDGITEAYLPHDENTDMKHLHMFGEEKLIEIMSRCGERSVKEIHDDIIEALKGYVCDDDVTFMIIRKEQQ